MGPLRWDGRDARFCIENRFALFARLCGVRICRAGTWRQPRAVCVRAAETCAGQVLRAPPEIQARMEGGQSAVFGRLLHVKHSVLREGNADIRTVAAISKTVRAEPESSFLTVICFTWNNGKQFWAGPFSKCAPESPPQGRRIYPAHGFNCTSETARGKRHVSPVMSESAEAREDMDPVFDTSPRVP